MSTADAVDREAAWLQTSGDSLAALLATAGGPFDNVQAYYPRTPSMEQRTLYVLRRRISQPRTANVRLQSRYPFHLIAWWPFLDGTGDAEAEQRALDAAVELVLLRISGPLLDKTHGGRFLSVAENPRSVEVEFGDPEQSIPLGWLRADITYNADDPELNA
jgi:hypothetical protein